FFCCFLPDLHKLSRVMREKPHPWPLSVNEEGKRGRGLRGEVSRVTAQLFSCTLLLFAVFRSALAVILAPIEHNREGAPCHERPIRSRSSSAACQTVTGRPSTSKSATTGGCDATRIGRSPARRSGSARRSASRRARSTL